MRVISRHSVMVMLLVLFAGVSIGSQAQAPTDLTQLMRAGENGDAAAQFDLGNRFLNGTGVEQDNFEALRWFTLAAEQENRNAQYNIAVMYLNGIGVIKDAEQAIAWFLRAAENGDPPSQFTLGIALFNGQLGVPQNTAEAFKWFTLAGAAGHQSAAANAVLVQELLPPEDVIAMQEAAKAWISAYKARQASQAAQPVSDSAVPQS